MSEPEVEIVEESENPPEEEPVEAAETNEEASQEQEPEELGEIERPPSNISTKSQALPEGTGDDTVENVEAPEETEVAAKSSKSRVSVTEMEKIEAAQSIEIVPVPDEEEEEIPDFRKSKSFESRIDDKLSRESLDKDGRRKLADKKKAKALGSIISIRKGNQEFFARQKLPRFENSYRLDSDNPFNVEKVEHILKDVLVKALENLHYDHDKAPKQAKWATGAIRARVEELKFDRYKIVCVVTIGEKPQDIYSLVRFLWDAERDKFAKYVYESIPLFAVGLCFGIYYE